MALAETYDAVVVGGGHNGLVCAARLAGARWRTLVVEAEDELGGAVRSAELTLPGFVHDVFSTNQTAFLGGPVYAELGADLERLGLRYVVSDRPFANVYPGGGHLAVYRDPERTLAGLRAHDLADADGWSELGALFDRFAPALFELLGTALPSGAALARVARLLREQGAADTLSLAQLLLCSTRELGDRYFATPEAKAMLASWGMHVDFGPDVAAGALFPFVESFADMHAGMALVEGGAARLIDALRLLLAERGGKIRTSSPVRRIVVEEGRATGIELESGERIAARRAVVATVTPTALYGTLLAGAPVPERVAAGARRFRYGPGTMMVHLALSGPVPWAAGAELADFAYVHVAPYVDDLAETYAASLAGLLPRSPMLVVGQPTAVDSSRAPEGKHVLWIQVRTLPAEIRGDAAGEISVLAWDEAGEPYADRVLAKLEEYAPGVSELVLARAVLTPADLERWNRNLVGGDNASGSHHLDQNFLFRPLPGWSRYRTPVDGLYQSGAGAWPGAGVTGLPGYLASSRLLAPHPLRKKLVPAAVAIGAGAALLAAFRRR